MNRGSENTTATVALELSAVGLPAGVAVHVRGQRGDLRRLEPIQSKLCMVAPPSRGPIPSWYATGASANSGAVGQWFLFGSTEPASESPRLRCCPRGAQPPPALLEPALAVRLLLRHPLRRRVQRRRGVVPAAPVEGAGTVGVPHPVRWHCMGAGVCPRTPRRVGISFHARGRACGVSRLTRGVLHEGLVDDAVEQQRAGALGVVVREQQGAPGMAITLSRAAA